jgi:hypothetical protein
MAQFIDERQEELDEDFATFEETEEATSEEVVETEQDTEGETEDAIPDKYKGKDIKDIVAMHQNAEQLLGKQGQEVGELRRIVDDFIKAQTVAKEQAQTSNDVDDFDFFDNPKESIEKLLANHPSLQQSQQLAAQMKQQEVVSRLNAEHPDYKEIIADTKFAEWVQKSKIRTKLLQQADQGYDYEAADELLTLWKERQGTLKATAEAEKIQRKQSVKSASSGTSRGSSERPSRKIYRRSDIIDLMRKDPERYEALAPEIRAAYAEGRVK